MLPKDFLFTNSLFDNLTIQNQFNNFLFALYSSIFKFPTLSNFQICFLPFVLPLPSNSINSINPFNQSTIQQFSYSTISSSPFALPFSNSLHFQIFKFAFCPLFFPSRQTQLTQSTHSTNLQFSNSTISSSPFALPFSNSLHIQIFKFALRPLPQIANSQKKGWLSGGRTLSHMPGRKI